MTKKYLLFSCTGVGLGHLFSAALASAYYAYRTGRAIAFDMREFGYAGTNNHTFFFENFGFEFPPELEVITDLDQALNLRESADLRYLRIGHDYLDIHNPFPNEVLLVPCLTPGNPYPLSAKQPGLPFRVTLKGRLQQEWDKVLAMPQWQGPVIGMHYRGTVGEIGHRMTRSITPDYDERFRALIDDYIAKATAVARDAGMIDPAFLVASDDADFVSYVQTHLPGAFSLATRRPDQEWLSHMRAHGFDFGILVDAVVDLWGLSSCDYLLCSSSGFTQAAILNSTKLNGSNTFEMPIPMFREILNSLDPPTAVAWARGAVRKADMRRMQLDYLHRYLADALDRAGNPAEAETARRRAQWHWDCGHAPVMDDPARADEQAAAREGDLAPAVARARFGVAALPGNPYMLAGYGHSLSNLLAQQGRLDEAIPPALQALQIEPADAHLHAHLADLLARKGDLADAETRIRQAIAIDPDVPGFHDLLADILLRQERIADAFAASQAAIALAPEYAHIYRRAAQIATRAGRLADAEAALRQGLAAHPEPALHVDLSDPLARQGRLDEAIDSVRTALAAAPDNAFWLHRLASLLLHANRPADAEEPARRAVALRPDIPSFQDLLDELLDKQGRLDEAIDSARAAAQRFADQPDRHIRLAALLVRTQRWPEADAAFRAAIALRPADAGLHDRFSTVLEQAGRIDDAAAEAERAASIAPSADRFARAGWLRLRLEQYAASEAALRQAVALRDDQFGLYHLLGIALGRQGKVEDAIWAARRVIEIDPSEPDRHAALGLLLMRTGRLAEAEAACRRAVAIRPAVAEWHDALSLVLEAQGRLDAALDEMRQASDAEPTQARWHARAAALLLRAERYPDAEQALRRAIALRPDAVGDSDTLCLVLERQQRIEDAVEETRRGLALDPNDPGRHLRLGNLLLRLRRPHEAEAALRHGLACDPGFAPLHDALATALQDQGRRDEAIGALRDAAAVKDDSALRQIRLGEMLANEDPDAAAEAFRRALAIDPHDRVPEDRLAALRRRIVHSRGAAL
ncbi:MAG TPA: tetratricopeptide repeat protein [Acetobacteraceae bacterium]|nr:tetratricopeptide repeat protein [Acetobacteraceae bacterium]